MTDTTPERRTITLDLETGRWVNSPAGGITGTEGAVAASSLLLGTSPDVVADWYGRWMGDDPARCPAIPSQHGGQCVLTYGHEEAHRNNAATWRVPVSPAEMRCEEVHPETRNRCAKVRRHPTRHTTMMDERWEWLVRPCGDSFEPTPDDAPHRCTLDIGHAGRHEGQGRAWA